MKRRRQITLEIERIVIRSDVCVFTQCETCGASTPAVTVEQAAMLIGEKADRLYSRAECGEVHSTRTSNGPLMICLKSLSALPSQVRQGK